MSIVRFNMREKESEDFLIFSAGKHLQPSGQEVACSNLVGTFIVFWCSGVMFIFFAASEFIGTLTAQMLKKVRDVLRRAVWNRWVS